MASSATDRYGPVSVAIHWVIAVLIFVQIGLGWWMNEVLPDHTPVQARVQNVHISLGLTILILVLLRIGVRLTHPAPPLPPEMAVWEKFLARVSHALFYLLMLVLPLSGWALVSLGKHPIHFWGLPWPHLPGTAQIFGPTPPRPLRHAVSHVHVYILIWIVLLNLALHVAGALKHQFDGHPVLWRMTGQARPQGTCR